MPQILKSLCSFLALLLLFAGTYTHAETPLQLEQAKATLLYNFVKQTQWPKHQAKGDLKVGFLGSDDSLYKFFNEIAGDVRVNQRQLSLRKIQSYQAAAELDVLVVGQKYNYMLAEIAAFLTQTNTLLISDGATNPASVMINFVYPKKNQLSFEVNSSNIIYENLKVSSDLLLYGGSEIEVARLYKEMEQSLLQSKARMVSQQQKLLAQQKEMDQQAEQINSKTAYILQQQADIEKLQRKQQEVQSLLNTSTQQLQLSREQVDSVQQNLIRSRELASQLSDQISTNRQVLTQQELDLSEKKIQLGIQTEQLGLQENTISSQRWVIYVSLCALLLVTLYIIFRQKIALGKERILSNTKAELVKAQELSIDAYKSTLQVKNNFFTAINHELRTPMHLIISALHTISDDDKNELQQSLGIVEQGAEKMMTLISDILFYSELQSEQLQINPVSAAVKKQLIEVCEPYKQQAEEKSLGFYLHFSSMVPDYATLDVERFCIVVEKLLDNAVKYTVSGDIVVNVGWHISQRPHLTVEINDSGIGLSPDVLEQALQPFEQAEAGLSRKYGGLGIGLSICDKLMALMQGEMTIVSDVQRGTSIKLDVPVTEATHLDVSPRKFLSLAVDNTHLKPLILVVEDNSVSQMLTEKIITSLGYRCAVADNGKHALEIVAARTPDLILMDLQMPTMDGLMCTQRLRQLTHMQKVPVVALTANPQEAIRSECMRAGMNAVLSKPVDVRKLTDVLSSLLSEQKQDPMGA